MKSLITIALLTMLTGCASLTDVLRGASAVAEIPEARAQVIEYLGPDVESIGAELAFLDGLMEQVQAAIDGDADISLQDAVIAVLGAPEQVIQIEAAYAAIEQRVAMRAEATGEPIPARLIVVNEDVKAQYSAVKGALLASERVTKAIELINLLKPIAIALL